MAFLAESNTWEAGIYQLETTDPVEGGAAGKDNVAPRQLANRTVHLKALVDALGTSKQPIDGTLTAIAALVTAADKLIYATGNDTFATTTLTAFARTLLDDADAATARDTLGAAPLTSPGFLGTPTAATPIDTDNSTKLATTAFVKAAVAALVNASPGALDTLNEFAIALGNDPNFATTITNALGLKAPLASPVFSGTPSLPTGAAAVTQAQGNSTTALATTAFVAAAVAAGGAGVATEAATGVVELATAAETVAGVDSARAIHPAGLKALMDSAAYAKKGVSNAWTASQAPVLLALADAVTVAWNCGVAQVAKLTLAGNRTMGAPTSVLEGAMYLLRVTQDATGSRVLTWNAAYKFGAAGAPTLTTTSGKTDFLSFVGGVGNTLEFVGYRLNGV